MTTSSASLSTLKRANGSATYSQGGYKIICAVNGPIEVQRRDEIPDQAAIEVNVRPVSGVGGLSIPFSLLSYHLNISILIPFYSTVLFHDIPARRKNLVVLWLEIIHVDNGRIITINGFHTYRYC